MTRLDLSIDELVLIDFAPADRHRLADEIERELGRMNLPHRSPTHPGRRAVASPARRDDDVGSVGHQVADHVSAVLAARHRS